MFNEFNRDGCLPKTSLQKFPCGKKDNIELMSITKADLCINDIMEVPIISWFFFFFFFCINSSIDCWLSRSVLDVLGKNYINTSV